MRLSNVPWRLVIGGLVVYLISLVGLLAASTPLQYAVVGLAVVICYAPIAVAIEPYVYRVAVDVRRPTDSEVSQLRPLCEEFDLQVDRIWVHDSFGILGPVKVNGVRRFSRQLFVDEVVLTDCSESEQRALLAWEKVIVGSRHRAYQPLILAPIFEAYLIAKLVQAGSSASGLAVRWYYLPEVTLVLLAAVVVYRQRQKVYAADDYVCDVTDANTFAHLIERLIEQKYDWVRLPRPLVWLLSVYWMSPTPARRLDRLREKSAR